MRKTTLLLCFLVVLMPIISQVATADYTVLNGGTSTVWLVVGTWMDKYKDLPEGYHVRGYYKVPPGECFIIRWGGGNYYIRMHKWVDGAQKLIRPSDHAERDSFAFPIVPKKRFRVVERGEVIRYSSVKRETLVKTGGFYEYKDGGTFHVSGPNLDKAKQALQPTVHALLVIDDADRKIGPSCVVDKTYIEDILSSVRHICPVQTKTLRSSTKSVGSYGANGYGLYDMTGNVWEWCVDEYKSGFYAVSPPRNPVAGGSIAPLTDQTNTSRVLRGGSWNLGAQYLRVANRDRDPPSNSNFYNGFRCARAVTP